MPSARTRKLIEMDKRHVWHPFTQMKDWLADPEPLVIEKGRGAELVDTDGRRYLDGISSLWVTVHGHRKAEIGRAIRAQLGRVEHSTLLGLANVPSIELAAELVKIAPKGLTKVFYSDSGSTAVEIALKMAFQYWQNRGQQRRRFVTLKEGYHGDTIGSVSLGGIDLFHQVYRPLLFETERVEAPYCYRCPLGLRHPSCGIACLDSLETILKEKSGEIAAVVMEPLMQGAAGMISAPPGHLKRVRELTRRAGVLLVADEVATGFGRTGQMFACQREGVVPDLMAVAKGLSGGVLPLAATLVSEEVYRGFLFPYSDQKTFFHGHTYTGNPLACAAALANLRLFRKEKTLARLRPKIRALRRGLESLRGLRHVGDIRQQGFMAGIELVRDKATREEYPWEEAVGVKVCRRARDKGVLLRPLGAVVVLMPPLGIRMDQLQRLLRVTRDSIEEVTEEP